MLKVKILKDDWQASINSGTSLVIAALVSFIILILTLFYRGTFGILETTVGLVACYLIFGIIGLWLVYKKQTSNLAKIDRLLKKIEDGEALPSLTELKKKA